MIMPIDADACFDGKGEGWLVYETGFVAQSDRFRREGSGALPSSRRGHRIHEIAPTIVHNAPWGERMPQMATDFDDLYNAAGDLIGRNLAAGTR